jgi:hypothetical protein
LRKQTAPHQIAVVMTIAVIVALTLARAAVVQITPPKLGHQVGLVEMVAANVAVVKLAVPVAVVQTQAPNRAVLAVKVRRKVDAMPVLIVDAENAAHKLDRRGLDDEVPALAQIVHSLHVAPRSLNEVPDAGGLISALVRPALNAVTPDVLQRTAVDLAADQ